MNDSSVAGMRRLVLKCVDRQHRLPPLESRHVPDDFNLLSEGAIDSLGFLQLVADLESELGRSLDLGELDPEQLATVGPLSRYLSSKMSTPPPDQR